MTVDELSAMIDECAGESVLHEAYAADPEQTRATLEKLVDDWNAGKDFDPAVYDLLMGRVVERDGDSTMQTGWLKQQAVSDLQALVIRQWISGLQRGAVVVLYKVLTDLGNGVCISKKGFRLMPLDIVEMWNSLHPDESPIRIFYLNHHAVVTVIFLQFFRAPALKRPAAIAVADSFRQLHDFLLPTVRVHHARGYYGFTAKLTVWHFSLVPFFASDRPT